MPTTHNPLADHIFGDLDTPQKGTPYLLKHSLGVHHHNRKFPLLPKPDEKVTLTATTSSNLPIQAVMLEYTTDDFKTAAELPFVKSDLTWDTLSWSWLQEWQVTLPAQPVNTMLRYHIYAQLPADHHQAPRCYADAQSTTPEEASTYAIWYGKDAPPHWVKNARIYQIFLDRFNPGEGKEWTQTADLTQPFGGTLRGVIEKLDYIHQMGFNAIWLTPIFASPSHHGYDTSNYTAINPRLGNQEDLKTLIQLAHKLGIQIILDFVANHVSDQNPAMQSALKKKDSPYHDWFYWEPAWPAYRCFYDVPNMPTLNLAYGKPAREHLLDCAQKWLHLGVDGYRLDYANGPEADFWVDFRHACREVNPNCWTFGEVVLPADAQRAYSGGMDGTLDFLTCQALRETIAFKNWPLSRLAGFIEASKTYFPDAFSRPAFIDNHDMNRFIYSANDDPASLTIALTVLYLLPGPPIVYFGTETALSQPRSIHDPQSIGFDESRLPMNWEAISSSPLIPHLKRLSSMREANPDLPDASWHLLYVNDEKQTALWQIEIAQPLYLALNLSTTTQQVGFPTDSKFTDLLTGQDFATHRSMLTLAPGCAMVLQGD